MNDHVGNYSQNSKIKWKRMDLLGGEAISLRVRRSECEFQLFEPTVGCEHRSYFIRERTNISSNRISDTRNNIVYEKPCSQFGYYQCKVRHSEDN